MNFASDNAYGVAPEIMEALVAANTGTAASYGADTETERCEKQLSALFERPVESLLVSTGSAANSIALSAYVAPYGAVLCHAEAHIMTDECGAAEFYAGGAELIGLPGEGAKIDPDHLACYLGRYGFGDQHSVQPHILSLTQATECGCVYTLDEIAALAEIAHRHGMKVHMDGARFANALVRLGCTAADMTWKAGGDVLSFGATKNGAMAAEAIVIFTEGDEARARRQDLVFRRKRGGHLLSKGRYLGAQMSAYLADDRWLAMARAANDKAQCLADGLSAVPGVTHAWPTEANEVFLVMPEALKQALFAKGAYFYDWPGTWPAGSSTAAPNHALVRRVCAFNPPDADIEAIIRLAGERAAA